MFIPIVSLVLYAINPKYFGFLLVILSVMRFFELVEAGVFWSRLKKQAVHAASGATHEEKDFIRECYKPFSPTNSLIVLPPYIFMFMAGLYIALNGVGVIGLVGYAMIIVGMQILFGTFISTAYDNGQSGKSVWWVRTSTAILVCVGWMLLLTQ